jgi:hypothetical protein
MLRREFRTRKRARYHMCRTNGILKSVYKEKKVEAECKFLRE